MVIFFSGIWLYAFLFICILISFYLVFFKKKSIVYLFFITVFFVYIYNLINLTQFPIYIDDTQRELFGGQNVWRDMNLIPFKDAFSITSLYNIIMTIPLGFALSFLIKTNIKRVFLIGLSTTFILELCQLLTALYAGYTFRVVDINDIIFNLLGTLIGYLVFFKIFKYIYYYFIKKLKINNDKSMILTHISKHLSQ